MEHTRPWRGQTSILWAKHRIALFEIYQKCLLTLASVVLDYFFTINDNYKLGTHKSVHFLGDRCLVTNCDKFKKNIRTTLSAFSLSAASQNMHIFCKKAFFNTCNMECGMQRFIHHIGCTIWSSLAETWTFSKGLYFVYALQDHEITSLDVKATLERRRDRNKIYSCTFLCAQKGLQCALCFSALALRFRVMTQNIPSATTIQLSSLQFHNQHYPQVGWSNIREIVVHNASIGDCRNEVFGPT